MKIKIFVIVFVACSKLVAKENFAIDTPEKPKELSILSSLDYQQLLHYTKELKRYGIDEKRFERLLWDGAEKALHFYQSERLPSSSANELIRANIFDNPGLYHPLYPPFSKTVDSLSAFQALNRFSGQWHGKWEAKKVHHYWLPVRKLSKDMGESFVLIGFQSCYTGDGIGWNYIVQKKNQIVILGYVYHFDQAGKYTFASPHYAYLNGENQLTWISNDHIYFEFVCDAKNCQENNHYVITGGRYEKKTEKPELVSGFQAIYLKEDYKLPSFKYLKVNHNTSSTVTRLLERIFSLNNKTVYYLERLIENVLKVSNR